MSGGAHHSSFQNQYVCAIFCLLSVYLQAHVLQPKLVGEESEEFTGRRSLDFPLRRPSNAKEGKICIGLTLLWARGEAAFPHLTLTPVARASGEHAPQIPVALSRLRLGTVDHWPFERRPHGNGIHSHGGRDWGVAHPALWAGLDQ